MRRLGHIGIFLLLFFVRSSSVHAAELISTPNLDVTVKYSAPNASFSSGPSLDALYDGGTSVPNTPSEVQESLFRFDLQPIPKGQYVLSAKLKLTPYGSSIYGYADIRLRRILSTWSANTTWNTRPTYASYSEANLEVTNNNFPSEIDVTQLVKDWYDNVIPNNGILMRPFGDGTYTKHGVYTAGDAHASSMEGPNPPKLIVEYGPNPPPTPSPTPRFSTSPNSSPSSSSFGTSANNPDFTTGSSGSTNGEIDGSALTNVSLEKKIDSCIPEIHDQKIVIEPSEATVSFSTTDKTIVKLYYYSSSRTSPLNKKDTKAQNFTKDSLVVSDAVPTINHVLLLTPLESLKKYFYTLASDTFQDCEHDFSTTAYSAADILARARSSNAPIDAIGRKKRPSQKNSIDEFNKAVVRISKAFVSLLTHGKPVETAAYFSFLSLFIILFSYGSSTFSFLKKIYGHILSPKSLVVIKSKHKKTKGTWGKVISSDSMMGIPGVTLYLQNIDTRQIIERTNSDSDGYYGFASQSGSYKLTPRHAVYTFPSTIMPLSYEGEAINIENTTGIVHLDIPMDPAELTNKRLQSFQSFVMKMEGLRPFVLAFAMIMALLALIRQPYLLDLFSFLICLGLLVREILHRWESVFTLSVKDETKPIGCAILRFYNRYNRPVLRLVANNQGIAFGALSTGQYSVTLTVIEKGTIVRNSTRIIKVKRSLLRQTIVMDVGKIEK